MVLSALAVLSAASYDALIKGTQTAWSNYFGLGLVVAGLAVSLMKSRQLYRRSFVLSRSVILEILKVWLIVFSLLAITAFLLKISTDFGRGPLVVYFLAGVPVLIGVRLVARHLLTKAIDAGNLRGRRVLLIGDNSETTADELGFVLKRHGYVLSKTFMFDSTSAVAADGAVQLPWSEIIRAARSPSVDEIMLAVRWHDTSQVEKIISRLRVLPISIRLLPDQAMSRYITQPIADIGLTRAVELQREPLRLWERLLKRSIDFIVSLGGLILFAPLMLGVAIMIKLDSPGPVFFRQTRVGFNGLRFRILKFRTMRTLEDGPDIRQATRDDGRITRIGKWLRATSVDELPQLVNVLFGEMSLVGPRPHAVAHDDQYDTVISDYALRHHVKPGITGWAQVCGLRGETPTVDHMRKRVEHDLWYIHNWSFWLDSLIMMRTAIALMRPQNAH